MIELDHELGILVTLLVCLDRTCNPCVSSEPPKQLVCTPETCLKLSRTPKGEKSFSKP